ncbi:MAG: AI-2E family transporter [Micavibrio sp.]|nr:AI-2E family transporter [Micavibrio sp.]
MTAPARAPFFTRVGPPFIVVFLVMYTAKVAAPILIPLVVAFFVWYLINALVRFIGMVRLGQRLPRFWRFVAAIAAICGVMTLFYALVSDNIGALMEAAPRYQESFTRIITSVAKLLKLENMPQTGELLADLSSNYVNIAKFIQGAAIFLTGMARNTLFVVVYVGFLLYEQRYFETKLRGMVTNKDTLRKVREVMAAVDIKIQRYIGVKAFVSLVDSTLTFAILTAFGVDFAAFWGAMAFFLHFIPYAGSFVAIFMPFLIALIQFPDVGHALMVLGVLCTSHAMLGHVLDPYLMGNNLNLSPIVIISNLVMWGMIWGIPGMFLGIPILAIVSIVLSQFDSTRAIAVLLSKTGLRPPSKRRLRLRKS